MREKLSVDAAFSREYAAYQHYLTESRAAEATPGSSRQKVDAAWTAYLTAMERATDVLLAAQRYATRCGVKV